MSSDAVTPNAGSAASVVSAMNSNQSSSMKFAGFDHKEFLRILTAEKFPEEEAKRWVDDHFNLTLQISTLYVLVIFGTKYLMRNRQPFGLFVPLNAWNGFLAVFSILGMINLTPEFFQTLFNNGFEDSYCKVSTFTSGHNGYWVWLFIVSKMFELVDTVFLVLRKRPLMFLHWYHHILTMIYAFYSYPISPGFNRWGIYLNYSVHAFMYTYYFLRSMKIQVPGAVAKFITSIQIIQFVISVAILIHLGFMVFAGNMVCDLDHRVFSFAVFMDMTYLILFVNFFLQAYILRGGKDKYKGSSKTRTNEKANGHVNGQMSNGDAKSNGTTIPNHLYSDDNEVRKRA